MCNVFFDFDKTLTKFDTLFPFALFLSKKRGRLKGLVFFANSLILLRFGKITNTQIKERFAFWLLKDEEETVIQYCAKEFLQRYINRIIDPDTFTVLRQHLRKKDEVCIVSANFNFFLAPLKRIWRLTDIIGTQTETVNGTFTGKIVGESCHGQEKLQRVIEHFGKNKVKKATAYGDSKADLFLLDYVSTGVLIQREQNFFKKLMFHLKFFHSIYFDSNDGKK